MFISKVTVLSRICLSHIINQIWEALIVRTHINEQTESISEKTMSSNGKYLSFSLFGSDLKYYVGAEKNVLINNQLLPDWETVIYYPSNCPQQGNAMLLPKQYED